MISVIMPCYNASAYIREAIESVMNQSYRDWELLIIDDGSTDDSCKIAKGYSEHDKRIRLIEQANSGACKARNNGIEYAKGKYIKFLDADDVLEIHCLEEQVKQIEQLQPNQIPFGTYGRIDKQSKRISEFVFSEKMLQLLQRDPVAFMYFHWQILITCPLHRKELIMQAGMFDTRLPRHQESDLHFRLALAGVVFVYYPIHTFDYREYNSDTRISTRFETGKINRVELNDIYIRKNEALLIEKYGTVPAIYGPSLAYYWYGRARASFAKGDVKTGKEYLTKVTSYEPLSGTRKVYDIMGRIFGYVRIESILRWRLRLLHKDSE